MSRYNCKRKCGHTTLNPDPNCRTCKKYDASRRCYFEQHHSTARAKVDVAYLPEWALKFIWEKSEEAEKDETENFKKIERV